MSKRSRAAAAKAQATQYQPAPPAASLGEVQELRERVAGLQGQLAGIMAGAQLARTQPATQAAAVGAAQPPPAAAAPSPVMSPQGAGAAAQQAFKDAALEPHEKEEVIGICEMMSTGQHDGQPMGLGGLAQAVTMFAKSPGGQKILKDEAMAQKLHGVLTKTESTATPYQWAMGIAKFIAHHMVGSAEAHAAEFTQAGQPIPDQVVGRKMMGEAFGAFGELGVVGLGPALGTFAQIPPEGRGILGYALTGLSWLDSFLDHKISSNLAHIAGKSLGAAINGKEVAEVQLQELGLGEKIKGFMSMFTGFFSRGLTLLKGGKEEDAYEALSPVATRKAAAPTTAPIDGTVDFAPKA